MRTLTLHLGNCCADVIFAHGHIFFPPKGRSSSRGKKLTLKQNPRTKKLTPDVRRRHPGLSILFRHLPLFILAAGLANGLSKGVQRLSFVLPRLWLRLSALGFTPAPITPTSAEKLVMSTSGHPQWLEEVILAMRLDDAIRGGLRDTGQGEAPCELVFVEKGLLAVVHRAADELSRARRAGPAAARVGKVD